MKIGLILAAIFAGVYLVMRNKTAQLPISIQNQQSNMSFQQSVERMANFARLIATPKVVTNGPSIGYDLINTSTITTDQSNAGIFQDPNTFNFSLNPYSNGNVASAPGSLRCW